MERLGGGLDPILPPPTHHPGPSPRWADPRGQQPRAFRDSGSMASGERTRVCCGGGLWTEKWYGPGCQEGGEVSAQPQDLGKAASSPRKGQGKQTLVFNDGGTSQKGLGSFPQTPDLLVSRLPAFLGSSDSWTVEFSQDRPLPPGLGFSLLPSSPRAVPLLGLGVQWRRKKGGLWVFMRALVLP